MYKVINFFKDGQDNGHSYRVGDVYPREGLKPSAERVKALLGKDNKRGVPMIVEVEEVETAEKTPKKAKKMAEEVVEMPEIPEVKKPRGRKAKK